MIFNSFAKVKERKEESMTSTKFRVLFISFLLVAWDTSANENLYYFQMLGPDIRKPRDAVFHSEVESPWEGAFREANKIFQGSDRKGEIPDFIPESEKRTWDQEGRVQFQKLTSDLDQIKTYDERYNYLIEIMDSPKTSPRLRSIVEHYFIHRYGFTGIERADQVGPLKNYIFKNLILKTLLYGSDKTDSEKINLLNTTLRQIQKYYAEDFKEEKTRYIRIASSKDRKNFEKSLTDEFNFLSDEIKEKAKGLNVPAGILGDWSEGSKAENLIGFLGGSTNLYFHVSLKEIDFKLYQKMSDEKNQVASNEVLEEYNKYMKQLEDKYPNRGSEYEEKAKSYQERRDRALNIARKHIELGLTRITIDYLIGPDHTYRKILLDDDGAKLVIFEKAAEKFKREWNKIRQISEEILASKEMSFTRAADQRFFELLFKTYFSTISYADSKNIIKRLIERPHENSFREVFRTLVLYSGPQMQKLLQILGRRKDFSPELRKIFNEVEDAGLKTPWEKVEARLRNGPEGMRLISINKEPKVGTMAQTYQAIYKDDSGNNLKIAARVLKDSIRENISKEEQLIARVAEVIDKDPLLRAHDFPLIEPILSDIHEMAREELNVELTKRNQEEGALQYQKTLKSSSIAKIEFMVPKTYKSYQKDVIYSSWLDGEKFESFAANNKKQAVEVAEAISEHWVERTFFTGFFFHTDLHQGNFNVVMKSHDHIIVNLFDFGMIGRLTENERNTFIKLAVAEYLMSPELIADYIWALSRPEENKISKSELITLVTNHPQRSSMKARAWLEWSLSKGMSLSSNVTALNRGLTAINQILEASESKKRIDSIMTAVALKNNGSTFNLVKSAFKDRFFGTEPEATSMKEKTSSCQRIF